MLQFSVGLASRYCIASWLSDLNFPDRPKLVSLSHSGRSTSEFNMSPSHSLNVNSLSNQMMLNCLIPIVIPLKLAYYLLIAMLLALFNFLIDFIADKMRMRHLRSFQTQLHANKLQAHFFIVSRYKYPIADWQRLCNLKHLFFMLLRHG